MLLDQDTARRLFSRGITPRQALEKTVKWYVENEWWWRKLKSGEYLEYYKQQYGERLAQSTELG